MPASVQVWGLNVTFGRAEGRECARGRVPPARFDDVYVRLDAPPGSPDAITLLCAEDVRPGVGHARSGERVTPAEAGETGEVPVRRDQFAAGLDGEGREIRV